MSHQRFETPGRLQLRVDNRAGAVRLRAQPGTTTEVDVSVEGIEDPELIEQVRVEHEETAAGHRVSIEVPGHMGSPVGGGLRLYGKRRVRVVVPGLSDLLPALLGGKQVVVTVRLPESATVEVFTASGEVSADGRFGTTTIETSSGDINVGTVEGDLEVRTQSGQVEVSSVSGETRVATASGDVRCGALSANARFRTASGDVSVDASGGGLAAHTASGDVNVGQVESGCHIETVSGDQHISRLVAGLARLESVSGDLTVGIAPSTLVAVDAETVSGDLASEIELGPDQPAGGDGGAPDDPRADLRAKTVSGDLVIRRAR